jgi:basic membrane protein A and related proteins
MKRCLVIVCALALAACKKSGNDGGGSAAPPPAARHLIGFVTDVGGRGDQSFNDSGLRGLELWAAGKKYEGGDYKDASPAERNATLPPDLMAQVKPLAVQPQVIQSKAQEDYEPNLQLLVDQGCELVVACGFALENAVEAVARRNPKARFLLIDTPLLDKGGNPITLPNVRTVVFREEEGSFLVGALAGIVGKKQIGFIGGMEVPLIKKFEAGFRAGVMTTNPDRARDLVASYTGSFDNVAAGKQIAQDMLGKGVDVIFHAAGTDGIGAIQAVKEARAAGKTVWVIGTDSDQRHLAPDAVLTSMIKRVDLMVYTDIREVVEGKWTPGDRVFGLKDGAITYAEVKADFPGRIDALARLENLRAGVMDGKLKVPSNAGELAEFKVP